MQTLIQSAAQDLRFKKQQAIAAYRVHRQPMVFFDAYGRAIETALGALWLEIFGAGRLCLLATGGFGRDEMYPYSDLDLAIVSPEPLDELEQEQIALFVQSLWDMQLAPAVKVGSIEELCASAADDITGDTAFLEARFICGSHVVAEQMLRRLSLQRDTAAFVEAKLVEMQQRHAKAQGSGAVLEPNVKTCPGGLRDIHTMLWLAKAQGLEADVHTLIQQRIITRAEAGLLMNSHKQLAKIRIDLHLTAGREEDRAEHDCRDAKDEA